MVERRTPISLADAVEKVMKHKLEGQVEIVALEESHYRFLAQDIIATNDVPHFNRSPYDGFALRSEDTAEGSLNNPLEFEVIEELAAGMVSTLPVQQSQVARIMTGAQMPDECDAVIMLELTKEFEKDGKKYISFKRSLNSGENVSFKGEDAKKGDILVKKGTMINPGIIGLLATFGYAEVPVAKKPVVGLFATGSELLDVSEPLQPGKIRNSNSHAISAQIQRAGGEVRFYGKLKDEFDLSYEAISSALEEVDLLITTGGVSVGDFDLLPDIYQKIGANVLFNKVAMRPGSVTTVAVFNNKFLFGLSGNPSASYVGFELFARPIIRTMLFSEQPHLRKEKAQLAEDFLKPNPFSRLLRTRLFFESGQLKVIPSGVDKSNITTSLAGANSLTVLPGGTRGFKTGDIVDVLLLDDQEGCVWPW
ncbi:MULTISPECIES: gephyrin-like molybdotransferase Glp [unclassified Peribacillus]|uniref:molybdopterin molybdotransferase MoeA n=1 Tax=unclassified Peribacillus TaxID=2675266 RepID=UPI0019134374|nr:MULTISPECIES: gephyrin-like molybdotransferase Glp [unclassified Peribacillus]MBK5444779.1 molybdopterin molybdotransferase MoeA [Peribacillus sp. TH24]MBK5460517.1 molybdopterin molybdotransferase MoeA [Peribacillus sp. TH27]